MLPDALVLQPKIESDGHNEGLLPTIDEDERPLFRYLSLNFQTCLGDFGTLICIAILTA